MIEILHGDCFELIKDVDSKSIDLILEDMPYNITACKWDVKIDLEKYWESRKRIIKDNGTMVLFAGEPFTSKLICSNVENFKYRITWDKMQGSGFLNSKKRPLTQCEDICVFSKVKLGRSIYNPQLINKDKSKVRSIGNRKPCDITTYGKHNSKLSNDYDNTKSHPTDLIAQSSKQLECNSINRVHPTQKPLELFKYLIKTYTNENDLVFDGFLGSGTTAVACKELNRNCIGIEQEEKYYEIANKRLMQEVLI